MDEKVFASVAQMIGAGHLHLGRDSIMCLQIQQPLLESAQMHATCGHFAHVAIRKLRLANMAVTLKTPHRSLAGQTSNKSYMAPQKAREVIDKNDREETHRKLRVPGTI